MTHLTSLDGSYSPDDGERVVIYLEEGANTVFSLFFTNLTELEVWPPVMFLTFSLGIGAFTTYFINQPFSKEVEVEQ